MVIEIPDMEQNNRILKAEWVLPVSSPPIRDGAVVINDSHIIAVGGQDDITTGYNGKIIDYKNAVIAPAWVNAHTHLELSYLDYFELSNNSFLDWVKAVVTASSIQPAVNSLDPNLSYIGSFCG